MSRPPEIPGSQRLKRAANRSGGSAYEGAFEAVGAILVATLLGYWFDEHFETTPTGVISGATIGFGAFVLRLVRMGRQFHPEDGADDDPPASLNGVSESDDDSEQGTIGVGLGLSDVFDRDDQDGNTHDKHEAPTRKDDRFGK